MSTYKPLTDEEIDDEELPTSCLGSPVGYINRLEEQARRANKLAEAAKDMHAEFTTDSMSRAEETVAQTLLKALRSYLGELGPAEGG